MQPQNTTSPIPGSPVPMIDEESINGSESAPLLANEDCALSAIQGLVGLQLPFNTNANVFNQNLMAPSMANPLIGDTNYLTQLNAFNPINSSLVTELTQPLMVNAETQTSAIDFKEAPAMSGNVEAQFRLGGDYLKGHGEEKDLKKGVEWIRKAANNGHERAKAVMVDFYARGLFGVPKNSEKAHEWLQKIDADRLNAKGMFNLAPAYSEKYSAVFDTGKAFELTEKSAILGNEVAQARLGDIYCCGLLERPRNMKLAFEWYKKSSDQGYAYAQRRLAISLRVGLYIKKDLKLARSLLQKSVEQSDLPSFHLLGDMWSTGEGGEKNYNDAFDYYKRGAELGSRDAQEKLGLMYRTGRGCSVDYIQAEHWMECAAKNGSKQAQLDLGLSYEKGLITPRDLNKARTWYAQAAAQGSAKAAEGLVRLNRVPNPTPTPKRSAPAASSGVGAASKRAKRK